MAAHRRCGLWVWQGRLTQVHTRQSLALERWIPLLLLDERPRSLLKFSCHETRHLHMVFQFDGCNQVVGVKVRRVILDRILTGV